ncbi:MAG: FMN-binding glutamate synthase family protein [Thiogranum sp.]|nr:FMN-binding glutamate synthase family protein [Thiogranum sp.]
MHTWFSRLATALLLLIAGLALLWPPVLWSLLVVAPLVGIGLHDRFQHKHTVRRNFPLFGRGRWIMEWLRPYVRQYLLESDTDGAPINRMFRNVVYQRAKNELDTVPFGTRVDTYRTGYEWIGHSLSAIAVNEIDEDAMRIRVGGPDCTRPYSASVLNISAMSFGALSRNAVLALSRGAASGKFYHNTGEGGISPYHLEGGADLVWQIGTGYFGCRDEQGHFAPGPFQEQAALEAVKMIEIKLSQGAKPGHGGILPADKNTPEIARIRGVLAGTQIDSPPTHTAFDSPLGLVRFIARLRELADGKPIGIKLAIGRRSEFIAICKAMVETGITPDFITVDGGEGGTGAAPLEYANSIGMPLREALAFADDCLIGYGLREQVRIIASGKILTGFHMVKNLALGADICNSARGMMLALGCVQSLVCNTNHCPTGVATQDPHLMRGLVVPDKADRVRNFHAKTMHAAVDIIASAGLWHTAELNRTHIHRRVSQYEIMRYDQMFPHIHSGCLLSGDIPETFALDVREADPRSFMPRQHLTQIEDECIEVGDREGTKDVRETAVESI